MMVGETALPEQSHAIGEDEASYSPEAAAPAEQSGIN